MRMISGIKVTMLAVSIVLTACQPSPSGLFSSLFDRGTELVDGTYAPSDHWSGQWRVINIWAEWCKPCWQEIPELNQFFALQGPQDIKLLGFNFDELEKTELTGLKEKMSIQFPVLTQWPDAWSKPDIKGLPATLILSPSDEVVTILWGPQNLTSLHRGIEEAQKELAGK